MIDNKAAEYICNSIDILNPIKKRTKARSLGSPFLDDNFYGQHLLQATYPISTTSSRDGESVDMTVLTEKADLLAVIQAVKDLPYVDGNDISLLGCSQGGFVSILAANEFPNEVHHLLLLYPALCIPDDARAGKMLSFFALLTFAKNNPPSWKYMI